MTTASAPACTERSQAAPLCPYCLRTTTVFPPPLARWVCCDCGLSWADLSSPGLPEDLLFGAVLPLVVCSG